MKKFFALSILFATLFVSCKSDDDNNTNENVSATFSFSHHWDGTAVTNTDFNTIQYTNANGEMLSIERLRYLISDVTFTNADGEVTVVDAHNLVDVTNNNNLSFNPNIEIATGTYTNVSFRFGFDNEDNAENYTDLNSESWNVPDMLGGGYHYMQFDGKFINDADEEQGFNYHAIRAVDNPGAPTFPQDTFFTVDLGSITITDDITFNVAMNIAEWFKNPIQWNLNDFNQMLMPNSAAQIMMYDNGQDVFSLSGVTQ